MLLGFFSSFLTSSFQLEELVEKMLLGFKSTCLTKGFSILFLTDLYIKCCMGFKSFL